MIATYVAYDTRSGRIISVHHGITDVGHARHLACHHVKVVAEYSKTIVDDYGTVTDEHIAVIKAPFTNSELGKLYKVDVNTKALVEAGPGEQGAGFSWGRAGGTTDQRPIGAKQ